MHENHSRRVRNVDPANNLLNVFETVFRHVFPNASARTFLGFKGLSERVISPEGWFLWLDDCPGVYALELAEAGELGSVNGSGENRPAAALGAFSIKYYPAMDEELFSHFTQNEQLVRTSDIFDNTGTPALEAESLLNASLFSIGCIEVLCAGDHLEFCLSAPEIWRCPMDTGPEPSRVPPPVSYPDRSVPAWRLSWRIFNRLVQGLCYFRNSRPAAAALFSDPAAGDPCRERGAGIRHHPPRDRFLALTFDSVTTRSPSVDPEPGAFITHFAELSGSGRGRLVCVPDPVDKTVSEWINPEWWEAEQYPISEDGIEYID